ncbi:MAG: hypothetical protein U0793_00250 [Gemmataceae bacterium]
MNRLLPIILLSFAVLPGRAAPVKEAPPKQIDLIEQAVETVELKGQEVTTFTATVTGSEAGPYAMYVLDAEGNCVAWTDWTDRKETQFRFTPPAQGAYTVELRSFAPKTLAMRLSAR